MPRVATTAPPGPARGLVFGKPLGITLVSLLAVLASLTAGAIGFVWLEVFGKPVAGDHHMDTLDFAPSRA